MDDTVESWVQLPACGACGRMMGWGCRRSWKRSRGKPFKREREWGVPERLKRRLRDLGDPEVIGAKPSESPHYLFLLQNQ